MPFTGSRPLVTVATYAYNEQENLPLLYQRVANAVSALDVDWEFLVVDDHSSDSTFQVLRDLAARDPRVRGIRLSRNSGSHMAKLCGLHHARGDCAIVLAADLQEPPELIPALLARWNEGAQVVSALRGNRPSEGFGTVWFSRFYYASMRGLLGFRELPPTDNSYCLLDRRVLEALRQFGESNTSIAAVVNWMGFRHVHVSYDQQARAAGKSGWTLDKKIKLFLDTATMFSFRPIRWILAAGGAITAAGLIYAATLALGSAEAAGWRIVLAAILIIGGLQLAALGILGEYLWRTLSEARRRPQYMVEETVGLSST